MNTKTIILLRDAERWNGLRPTTFPIPSVASRHSIGTGDIVKLWFVSTDPRYIGERMWAVVRECLRGQIYLATLNSEPISLPLAIGTWVRFGPRHVLDIYDRNDVEGTQ